MPLIGETPEKSVLPQYYVSWPKCGICLEDYNGTDRKPMILHPCCHGMCSQCLPQMKQAKCHLCRSSWTTQGVNWQLLQVLPAVSSSLAKEVSNHLVSSSNLSDSSIVERETEGFDNDPKNPKINEDRNNKEFRTDLLKGALYIVQELAESTQSCFSLLATACREMFHLDAEEIRLVEQIVTAIFLGPSNLIAIGILRLRADTERRVVVYQPSPYRKIPASEERRIVPFVPRFKPQPKKMILEANFNRNSFSIHVESYNRVAFKVNFQGDRFSMSENPDDPQMKQNRSKKRDAIQVRVSF